MVMDFIENGNHADKSDSDSERENGTNQQDASDDDEESDFEPVSSDCFSTLALESQGCYTCNIIGFWII